MKYYCVVVSMGHLGTGKSLPVKIYVEANDMFSAIKKAQRFPGVKHSRFPVSAKVIDKIEFDIGLQNSEYLAFMRINSNHNTLEI